MVYNYKDRQMVKTKQNISDIRVDVPEGHSGDWRVERFTVSKKDADFHNLRCAISSGGGGRDIEVGTYTRLLRGKGDPRTFGGATVVMSDTPAEIRDHSYFVHKAEGHVLINGLGLGWVVEALLRKPEVKTITVIEKSLDVINLVAEHYEKKCPKDKKLWILQGDALYYQPPKNKKYDAVWHDIWDYICADNLEEMKKLHRKYGRRTKFQGSWCRAECERANGRW
jgi:hypothetical protein